jgi:prephenate dehydrogenase
MAPSRRALIAGLGLIGGSIGMALRRAGWHVAYLDPHVDDPRDAADERAASFVDADVTILATPVDVAVGIAGERCGGPQPAASIVTSVCSVMRPLRAAAGDGARFVAGHPLAGKEQRGLDAADGALFEGKRWFVDREEPLVDEVIAACGAQRELVDAAEHDAAVALTSHLPQLLSTALGSLDVDPRFAGSGLRTFLRLAGSDAAVWMPILEANRDNVRKELDALTAVIDRILGGDAEAFARAQRLLARLSSAPQ